MIPSRDFASACRLFRKKCINFQLKKKKQKNTTLLLISCRIRTIWLLSNMEVDTKTYPLVSNNGQVANGGCGNPPPRVSDEHIRRVVRQCKLTPEEIRRLTQDMNVQTLADLILVQDDLAYIFQKNDDTEIGPLPPKDNLRFRRMEAILYELDRGLSPFLLDSRVFSQILMERRCKERKHGQALVIPTIFHMAAGVIILQFVTGVILFLLYGR